MNQDELINELLQGLTNDVQKLSQQVSKLPTQFPADYRVSIEDMTKSVQELGQQIRKGGAIANEPNAMMKRFDRIEEQIRERPEYKMSRYVQYGMYGFGLLVVLLATSTWFAFNWKKERDLYQGAHSHDNWRVRYTKQVNPEYYSYMEGVFSKEPEKTYQWVLEQEQADEKRELARKAAEQAKALTQQANKLEGKSMTKEKKNR